MDPEKPISPPSPPAVADGVGGVETNQARDIATNAYDDPFNFSRLRKWAMTISGALLCLTVTFASSIFSAADKVAAEEFRVSETVMILGISLFVLGFVVGPLVWGPLSEQCGRRIPLFVGYGVFTLMQIPTALSPTLSGVLISRFLAGCFGSAPLVLVSAIYADFWLPAERALALSVFAAAIYVGPTMGPVVGNFIVQSQLGWRWTAWIVLIASGVCGPTAFLLLPETYAPVLKERAARQRMGTQETGLEHALSRTSSAISKEASKNFVRKYLAKPILMLFHELMLDVMTLYISLAYGILYLTFYAYPYSFTIERGWKPQIGSLPFLAIFVGAVSGCVFVAIYNQRYYAPRIFARGGKVVPEDRLPLVMVGAILLPIGLFWFAWTSSPSILWVPQVLSGFCIGAGIMLTFSMGLAFVIDVYLTNAASAVAANTAVRSVFGAALPLAGPAMYKRLGTAWATSLLGFACVLLVPAPFLFYKYGERMRKNSKYAWKQGLK